MKTIVRRAPMAIRKERPQLDKLEENITLRIAEIDTEKDIAELNEYLHNPVYKACSMVDYTLCDDFINLLMYERGLK